MLDYWSIVYSAALLCAVELFALKHAIKREEVWQGAIIVGDQRKFQGMDDHPICKNDSTPPVKVHGTHLQAPTSRIRLMSGPIDIPQQLVPFPPISQRRLLQHCLTAPRSGTLS